MRTRLVLLASLTALSAAAVGYFREPPVDFRADEPDPELLHAAVKQLTDVIVYDIYSPPQASRTYAYASIAAYEALRHDDPSYQTMAGRLAGLKPVPEPEPGIYLPLAGVHAYLTVGRALTASQDRVDSLRAEMHARVRRTGVPAGVFERSVAYGEQVAKHILAWASEDRFIQTRGFAKFSVTSEPGRWVPTPPGYMDAVEPNWGKLRPFVMDSGSQFRPAPPHPFDMRKGSPFHRQVMEVYETGRNLTEEQRRIAAFWDCNPYVMNVQGHAMFATKKISPGGHWMGIAAIAARQVNADLVRSADTYARTAIALADAFISVWNAKYVHNLLRPETVINAHIDEGWAPLLQTPPFPEYTSGHSGISTAAAEVLSDLYGDEFAFVDTSEEEYGLPARSFPSFRAAAEEAAMSRLYGGIHYRMAIEEGVTQGREIGELIVERLGSRTAARAGRDALAASR